MAFDISVPWLVFVLAYGFRLLIESLLILSDFIFIVTWQSKCTMVFLGIYKYPESVPFPSVYRKLILIGLIYSSYAAFT